MKIRPAVFGAALIVGVATVGAWAAGLRWNGTASMPIGLWMEEAVPAEIHRGDVVLACVPWHQEDFVAPYVVAGTCQDTGLEPLLKPVAATPGDTVIVTDEGVIVNGQLWPHSAPLVRDGAGRALPYPMLFLGQEVTVPDGYVWLVAPMDLSLDSRYLGPFPTSSIIGIAKPVLVK